MDQQTVLASLNTGADREDALAALARGPRAIDCPDLGSGRLVFTRYREVRHLLRAPGFTCAPTARGMLDELPPELRSLVGPVTSWVLYADAPQHPRIRTLLSKAFAPRRIAALERHIADAADELVKRFIGSGGGDAVSGLAEPLPVDTISTLLGIPIADRATVKAWSDDVILLTEPALTGDQEQQLARAWTQLASYFGDLIEQRSAQAGDDIVSAFVDVEAQGDRLTRIEAVSNLIALLVGGHETTGGLISALLLAAAEHPEHWDRVLADDAFAAGFVEEVLRLYGPAMITARTAAADCDVFGIPISAGRRLVLLQSSANRDPEIFEEPEEFRPDRSPNPHVAFGHGPHACFGAALARMEATAMLRAFVRRADQLRIQADQVAWKPSQVIRSASLLPTAVVSGSTR
ncbi:cytochrome P450 [Kitasatospora sp. NBC_00374]|uniref:cytochrome P450 n=1 Tax=Kitasatospora sp. NBC_00374 TaxID=2975964 RepID=UPI0030E198B9